MRAAHAETTPRPFPSRRGLLGVLLTSVAALCAFAPPEEPPGKTPVLALTRPDGTPLTPLALVGRDVFGRAGCYHCHAVDSDGFLRGPAGEGEARWAGPSLQGVGGRYLDRWHVVHLMGPQAVSPGSVMPTFAHLASTTLPPTAAARVVALQGEQKLPKALSEAEAARALAAEGKALVRRVVAEGGEAPRADSELVALVAWLQQQTLAQEAAPTTPLPAAPKAFDAAIRRDSKALAARGRELFQQTCTACHGADGKGGVGPSLVDSMWRYGGTPSAVFRSIADGHPARGMPGLGASLPTDDLRALTAYVAVTLRLGK